MPQEYRLILQHADAPTAQKYCELVDPDKLSIEYALSRAEQDHIDDIEALVTAVRKAGELFGVPA